MERHLSRVFKRENTERQLKKGSSQERVCSFPCLCRSENCRSQASLCSLAGKVKRSESSVQHALSIIRVPLCPQS
jgi:hypothetical protein